MPKAVQTTLPLNGIFGIEKPSGWTCMSLLEKLKILFATSDLFVHPSYPSTAVDNSKTGHRDKRKRSYAKESGPVKLGQGGTLDPAAFGILVIGVGTGTKKLKRFLECKKTTGLLGCATTEYDAMGKRTVVAPYAHVTRQAVESALDAFRGEISQRPPLVEGQKLYEYARSKTPLPKPIESREVTISNISITGWSESGSHSYKWPTTALTPAELEEHRAIQRLVDDGTVTTGADDAAAVNADEDGSQAPTFEITMTVSSGTYVRSIVHDLGIAVGSAAHVVSLERTVQGDVSLDDCLDWPTVQAALDALENKTEAKVGESGRKEWEEELLRCFRPTETLDDD